MPRKIRGFVASDSNLQVRKSSDSRINRSKTTGRMKAEMTVEEEIERFKGEGGGAERGRRGRSGRERKQTRKSHLLLMSSS